MGWISYAAVRSCRSGEQEQTFFQNVRVEWDGSLLNGQPDGYGRWKDETGTLHAEGEYRDGVQVGVWILYRDGQPFGRVDHDRGNTVEPY